VYDENDLLSRKNSKALHYRVYFNITFNLLAHRLSSHALKYVSHHFRHHFQKIINFNVGDSDTSLYR
jgi:hypothetical protein